MANVLISEDTMTDIADAIRTKKGVSTTYKPNEMPSAIESISGGGVTPTGTINITTNGTHDVTNYASANVAVPQGTTPTGTKQISITQNGTTTEDVTNYASAQITVNVQSSGGYTSEDFIDVNKPVGVITNDTSGNLANYILYGRKKITEITLPNITFLGDFGFMNSSITKVNAPSVSSMGTSVFQGCTGLTNVVLQSIKIIYTSAFNGCSNLVGADFGGSASGASEGFIRQNAFNGCTKLNKLVLRGNSVWTLSNINNFANTPFASGKTGGTLYVPNALIASYQSANNWSTILGYANNQIVAIEGSAYESQYVDGTPISS